MVSSSLDKSKKKALDKEPEPSDSFNTNTNAVATLHGDRLPPSEKIQLLFPKCKPRSDYQYQTSTATTTTPQDTPISTNLISIASSSSQSIHQQQQQPFKTQKNNFNMNNSKLLKLQSPISPDHKKRAEIGGGIGKSSKSSAGSKHSEANENYVETNPFRIGSNNQYFYAPNDSLFDNNNSAMAAASNNNSMMHHYHYPPMMHRSNYQMTMDDRNYFFEPDEIEHNPYVVEAPTMSTISSSVLKTTPPATPPALTTTPTENSPMGSSRNIWDLSPIKANTPTRIKSQSPTSSVPFSRQHKGSYKKLLSSPIPIEEDLETGHFYYNNKKPYYQAPQTDSDSNEPAILTDVHEVEKLKSKPQMFNKSKIRPSESSDYIYAEVKKKDERKIVKSKSGSGIMEYDGSPRRFGMSSNDDTENQLQSASKQSNLIQSRAMPLNYPSPTPARPGFPQRVVSYDQHMSRKSPEPYSYSDHKGLATYTATSKLIPTTFINSNAYEEERETIHEDAETNSFQDEPSVTNRNASRQDETFESSAQQQQPQQYKSESASVFQVTSPTEENIPTSTFDYLYEFSETRKVLEEFFKCPESDKIKELEKFSDFNESDDSLDIQYDYRGQIEKEMETMYNKEMASSPIKQENDIDDDNRDDKEDEEDDESYLKAKQNGFAKSDLKDNKPCDYYLDSASRSSLGDENVDNDNELDLANSKHSRRMSKSVNSNYFRRQSKNFHYSPDTTDYDSNYGDFDFESESSLRFLATDHSNMPTFTTSASATVPSATVDLSGGPINNYARYCTSMPVLEDGLSSGHASDNENNNQVSSSIDINTLNKRNNIASSISTIQKQYQDNLVQSQLNSNINSFYNSNNNFSTTQLKHSTDESDFKLRTAQSPPDYHSFYPTMRHGDTNKEHVTGGNNLLSKAFKNRDPELESLYTINTLQLTPPPPAPVPHRQSMNNGQVMSPHKQDGDIHSTLKDIQTSLQKSKTNVDNSPTHGLNNNNCNLMSNINDYYDRSPVIPEKVESPAMSLSPVWIPRSRDKVVHSPNIHESGPLIPKHKNDDDEEEVDTDLETDRLLGHQMLDDGFYDDKNWSESKQQHRGLLPKISPKVKQSSSMSKSNSSSLLRHGLNVLLPTSTSSECCINNNNSPSMLTTGASFHQTRSLKTSPALNSSNLMSLIHPSMDASEATNETSPRKVDLLDEPKDEQSPNNNQADTIELCNLDSDLVDSPGGSSSDKSKKDDSLLTGEKKKKNKNKEVLIEGVLFRARYLGSTQLVCEGQPTKSTRMMQAEEAVSRIKAPDGENQPSTEVDLFISTEKIMVLNTDLKEIMMDHALRTISYIADIGDLVVLMARRRFVPQDVEANSDSGTGTGGSGNVSGGSGGPTPPTSGKINRTPKMICHVFESEEAQFIAQSIGQAFQVAYMEFLKANGIEDHSFMKEMDYQEVLNSQEIFGDELEIFAKKELQKEVVVPKAKGEILGVVIVESGWGSMLPTVVIANLASNGAAARCGQLNIGDQIIAINGLSLVGLPLSQCQTYIKNTKNQTVVKFTVVPCAPVVEVKIKRPNTKYQLGFSVQNGVICSLLRGGIAERGGVRVGHRIIEINNQSVVAVPHEKIVNLLATSVGEILMKTMPTSMFRLLTGQENPIYI